VRSALDRTFHLAHARLENITPVEFDDEVSQRLLGDLIMNQGAAAAGSGPLAFQI